MKISLLFTILLTGCSFAYAGSCDDKSGDSSEKDAGSCNMSEISTLIVSGCGGCGGDKSDKTDKSGKSSYHLNNIEFAGSSCDDEDGKKCGGKKYSTLIINNVA